MTLSRDWMTEALCAETGGDYWFADDKPDHADDVKHAKRVCALCPVKNACLEYALLTDERFGIWGGITAKTRLRLRRRRGLPPREHREHGTIAGAKQHRRRHERLCASCVRAEQAYKERNKRG